MKTRSGRLVLPNNDVVPSLDDFAFHLSHVPRFGGGTVVQPWTVAQHSLLAEELVWQRTWSSRASLHGLFHDLHEAVTGDIPGPWKTDDIRKLQRLLDVRIYHAYDLPLPTELEIKLVHEADEDLLLSEALIVGPPGAYEVIQVERGKLAPLDAREAVMAELDKPAVTAASRLYFRLERAVRAWGQL